MHEEQAEQGRNARPFLSHTSAAIYDTFKVKFKTNIPD